MKGKRGSGKFSGETGWPRAEWIAVLFFSFVVWELLVVELRHVARKTYKN